MSTREQIASALRNLNAAENARPETGVEVVSTKIDAIMAPDVEGWRNGVYVPDRATEREVERKSFGALTDYHRTIERTIIDPPFASIGWTIRGTFEGKEVSAPGSSIFEFNDSGRVQRYWMHFNPEHFFYRSR
ncbi:MAG: hypothetical protein GC205_13315 [Bacteroidetes bacterium]|nr:hypothetical protein [Bacteroidota bacterium]